MSAAQPIALAVVERDGIEPRNMTELLALAKAAAGTGFFGAKTPEQALLICMSGRDLGLSYSQALRAFHVIEGRPSLSADGMVAACLVRRDVCEFFRTIEVTDQTATVETKRMGQEPRRYTFTMGDAQRAEVSHKPPWKRYPSRMLLARARAALARDVYPDLLLGLYDPDEIGDVAPAPLIVAEAPARAPETRTVTVDGEVVEGLTRGPSDTAKKLAEEFVRCGIYGTSKEHRELVARAAKLSSEDKVMLSKLARDSKVAVKHREAAKAASDASFDAEGRQPGEEG